MFFLLLCWCLLIKWKEIEIVCGGVEFPFTFFIKYDISTDYNLPIIWIVQLVAFRTCIIADEDEFFTFIIKLGSSFIRYMNMSYASKDS